MAGVARPVATRPFMTRRRDSWDISTSLVMALLQDRVWRMLGICGGGGNGAYEARLPHIESFALERPALLLIGFHQRHKGIELVTLGRAVSCAPKPLDFSESAAMVVIVADRRDVHGEPRQDIATTLAIRSAQNYDRHPEAAA